MKKIGFSKKLVAKSSVLVVMIVFSLVLFIPSVKADSVHKYDYTTGVGTDKWAFHVNTSAGNDNPPANPWARDIEFTSSDYEAINDTEDSRAETTGGGATINPAHIFEIKVSESVSSITKLDFYWEGYGPIGSSTFYFWNWASSSWVSLGSHSSTTTDGTVTASNTSKASDYVNSTGYIELTAVDIANKATFIKTDYIYVNVTYTVADTTPPQWSSPDVNVTNPHRGEYVNISTVWQDTGVGLKYSWLSTNETGEWKNYTDGTYGSPRSLSGTDPVTVNFTWMNDTGKPRVIGWIIYANDTGGYENGTDSPAGVYEGNFTMWGWSNITWTSPLGGSANAGDIINLTCFVNDTNATGSGPIENYIVSFYNVSVTAESLLGTNLTNSTGHVIWAWNTSGLDGTYYPKCNITDNSTLYYNASEYYEANTTISITPVGQSYTRDVSQSLTFSSSLTRSGDFVRGLTNSFQLNSLSPRSFVLFRPFSEILSTTSLAAKILDAVRSFTQSFTISTSITTALAKLYERLASVYLTLASVVQRTLDLSRTLTQSFSVSTLTARLISLSRAITQSLSTSTITARAISLSRAFTNSFQILTTIQAVAAKFQARIATLPLTISTSITRILSTLKNIPLSFNINTLVLRAVSFSKQLTQALTTNSLTTRIVSLSRQLTQALNFNLLTARVLSLTRMFSQSFNFNTLTTRLVSLTRPISQSFGINTLTARVVSLLRTLSQSFSVKTSISAVTKMTYERLIGFYFTLTSSPTRLITLARSVLQSLTLNSIVQRIASFPRVLIQSLSISTLTTRVSSLTRVFTQTLTANLVTTRIISLPRLFTQSLNVNTLSIRVASIVKSLTQSLTQNLLVTRTLNLLRTFTQAPAFSLSQLIITGKERLTTFSLSISSNIAKILSLPRILTQSLNINSLSVRILSLSKVLSQSLGLNTIATRVLSLSRVFTNSFQILSVILTQTAKFQTRIVTLPLTITTSVSRILSIIGNVPQSISLNTLTARIVSFTKTLSQTLTTTLMIQRILTFPRTITQSLSLNTLVTRILSLSEVLSQTITFNTLTTRLATFTRPLLQSLTFNTLTTRLTSLTKILTQTLNFSTLTTRLLSLTRSFTNQIPFSSSITYILGKIRELSQSFTVTTALTKVLSSVRDLQQSLTFNTIVTRIISIPRAFTQTLTINTLATRILTLTRVLSQSFQISSIMQSVTAKFQTRIATLPLTITTSISRLLSIIGNVPQAISFNTLTARIVSFTKAISQSFSASTITARLASFSKVITQSFSTSTLVSRLASFSKIVSESFNLSTITARLIALTKVPYQSFGINTITTRIVSLSRTITQSFTINTSVSAALKELYERVAGVSLTITSVVQRVVVLPRELTQGLTTSTIISRIASLPRVLSQTLSINSISSRIIQITRVLTQLFNLANIAEGIKGKILKGVATVEFSINQAIQRTLTLPRTISQGLNLNVITTRVTSIVRTFINIIRFLLNLLYRIPCLRYKTQSACTSAGCNWCVDVCQAAACPTPPPEEPYVPYVGVAPPFVPPVAVEVEFAQWPVLREIAQGQATVLGILVKNAENSTISNLKVNTSGISKEWVTVSPKELSLGPYEKKGFNVGVGVPSSALAGDYKVIVTVSNVGVEAENFFILRVKSYAPDYDKPRFMRIVEVDSELQKTNVEIIVDNPQIDIPLVEVIEKIPKDLATTSDIINFQTSPTKIIRKDPLIQWDLLNFSAGEIRTILYSVPRVLEEFTQYIYWPLEQVNILTVKGMPTGFKLVYMNIPSLHPGKTSELTFKIENTDTVSHTLNITADLPVGWEIEPEIIEVIEARETKELKLYLSLPSDAISGTYIIRIFFTWDEDIIMREYSVSVRPYIPLVVYILIYVITGLGVIITACLLWRRYKKAKRRIVMIEILKQERKRLGWRKE